MSTHPPAPTMRVAAASSRCLNGGFQAGTGCGATQLPVARGCEGCCEGLANVRAELQACKEELARLRLREESGLATAWSHGQPTEVQVTQLGRPATLGSESGSSQLADCPDEPSDCLLPECLGCEDGQLLEARVQDLAEVADAEDLFALVYQFSELQPGESLQEHVQRQVAAGTCPHPSQEATLQFVSRRGRLATSSPDLASAREAWARFWSQHARSMTLKLGTETVFTPLHQMQEWQAFLKNSLNGNYRQYAMTMIMPGVRGVRDSAVWVLMMLPIVLVDEEGRRFWGMLRQIWQSPKKFTQTWAMRDVHAKKLTLYCCTYVSKRTGAILSQNHTSMSMFGIHGGYHAELGLTRKGQQRSRAASSPGTGAGEVTRSYSGVNFLDMLFAASKEELGRVHATVDDAVYRCHGLQIVHPLLRAWMGVPDGKDVFHDVQIVANQDPDTLEQIYAISQIDVTDRVLAERQLQQAHAELAEDKARLAVLTNRQYDLIACLGKVNELGKSVAGSPSAVSMLHNMRRQLLESSDTLVSSSTAEESIQKLEVLGAGSFGSVHKAIWNGRFVAVKSIFLPTSMSAGNKRETLAVMEAAISSSLLHENIVQTYTYRMHPVRGALAAAAGSGGGASTSSPRMSLSASGPQPRAPALDSGALVLEAAGSDPDDAAAAGGNAITGFEVQLVLELCDRGSLRQALDRRVFCRCAAGVPPKLDYVSVLETAADIARGMAHLHSLGISHCDLKPHNVLLQSTGDSGRGRGFCAKIADFGLALQTDASSPSQATVMGTAPYIAPELWNSRVHSLAADVYAFGITLWELYSGGSPLRDVPLKLVALQVVDNHLRPSFPEGAPAALVSLAQRCWAADPPARPTFEEVLRELESMAQEVQAQPELQDLPYPDLTGGPGDEARSAAAASSTGISNSCSNGGESCCAAEPTPLLSQVDSPAERMLLLLEQLMCGEEVTMSEVMQLHRTILTLRDVRQPVNLAKKLQSMNFDADVCSSLLLLLSTPETRADPSANVPSGARQGALDTVDEGEEGSESTASSLVIAAEGCDGDGSGERTQRRRRASVEAPPSPVPGDAPSEFEPGGGSTVITPTRYPSDQLQLLKQPPDAVAAVLAKVGQWQFDTFELAEASGGRPLSTLAFAIIRRCHVGPTRGLLAERELATYLRHIEDGYRDVPYHNSTHAADVLHTTYTLLTTGGVLQMCSTDPDMLLLAAVFAATIHDYEHVGLNNDYLIRSKDELALRYNDRSPMENHHLAAAFALLQRPGCNFLSGLPDKSLAAFRRQVIEMVLATDMKQHFAMVSLFNTKFGPPAGSSGSKGDCKSGSSLLARRNSMSKIDHSPALTLDDDTLSLVLQMALKVADLGSLAAAADANRKWVLMLEEEMFLQGDKERQAGLPISPLMDRHCSKGGVSRSQTGFFRVVALPMFETFAAVFPGTKTMLLYVNENYARWQLEGK